MPKSISFFTALFIYCYSSMLIAQPVPSYVPTNGLVGWWPFTGNAADHSSHGNDGNVNGAVLTTDRYGNADAAYYFNGSSSFIQTPDSPSLVISGDITMAAWVYDEGPSNAHFHTIISKRYTGYLSYNMSLSFYYDQFGSPTELKKVFSGRGNALGGFNYKYSGDTIDINAWQHLVVRIQNDTVTFFKNGVDMGYNQYGHIFNNPIVNQDIGVIFGKTHQNGDIMKGKIDDIGIWNRALNQQEITDLYNGVSSGVANPDDHSAFIVFPNPARQQIHIRSIVAAAGLYYHIYTLSGKEVLSGQLTGEDTMIAVGNLPAGIYLLQVGDERSRKVMIVRE